MVAEANSKQCNVGLGRGKIGLEREGKLGQQREKRQMEGKGRCQMRSGAVYVLICHCAHTVHQPPPAGQDRTGQGSSITRS